jgi:DNA-binding NarL/FixJ family response regulator
VQLQNGFSEGLKSQFHCTLLFVINASDSIFLAELIEREREILSLMARRYVNPEIAQQLGISPKTIRNHIANIFNKQPGAEHAEASLRARQAGLE